ncbi:methylmalonyl-CoA mutase family protein, partial [Streptomyces sp. 24-1644]|uniref:methylmalonyl-CoA mutase family protein n=1 Tax=Streptomyces sp. 24-1644 TaxID=3457315 RepID=UPI003FA6ED0A
MTVLPADGLPLAAEFSDPSHEQWQRLVEGVLRKSGKEVTGTAAEEALSTALEDGLTTRPLYTSNDSSPAAGLPGFAPFTRGGRAEGNTVVGWDVRPHHTLTDPARLNEAVLADLENGATSLWLTVGGPAGIPAVGLARALDGVLLDLAPVALDAGGEFE